MAELELQESEVIFQEDPEDVEDTDEASGKLAPQDPKESCNKTNSKRRKLKKTTSRSSNNNASSRRVPASVYHNITRRSSLRYSDLADGFFDDYGDCDAGDFVPPHIIIRRRFIGRAMSFSMCSGYGRTLKGRDLCEFRKSILMRTGFLE